MPRSQGVISSTRRFAKPEVRGANPRESTSCGGGIEFDADYLEHKITCPHCEQETVLENQRKESLSHNRSRSRKHHPERTCLPRASAATGNGKLSLNTKWWNIFGNGPQPKRPVSYHSTKT